ncbi:MAG TPA: haloacid dehalogenase-like hydrolase [Streptosporangiaceae bacterium]
MGDTPESDGARRVAVFDLDGTLLRGDSLASFITSLLFRDRIRAAVAVLAAPLLGLMFFVPVARRRAISALLWLATTGLPAGSLDGLLREFADRHAADGNQIAVALDRLHAHLSDGDHVVIATACAEDLASELCRALGLDQVQVVGARLSRGRSWLPAAGCRMWDALPTSTGASSFGAEKVRRLREAGISTPVSCAYTDSTADLPLLLAASRRYLVDPSPAQLRRLRAGGISCEVLRSAGQLPGSAATA